MRIIYERNLKLNFNLINKVIMVNKKSPSELKRELKAKKQEKALKKQEEKKMKKRKLKKV
ncbi:MAG TPA: hypothetical protein VK941_02585 [Gillisia sp.]|nr:hypothetical protein [Gillisia sp.]